MWVPIRGDLEPEGENSIGLPNSEAVFFEYDQVRGAIQDPNDEAYGVSFILDDD